MFISFECENCGNPFNVDARFAGKKAKCKKCGGTIIVPAETANTSQQKDIYDIVEAPAPTPPPRPKNPDRAASPGASRKKPVVDEAPANTNLKYAIISVCVAFAVGIPAFLGARWAMQRPAVVAETTPQPVEPVAAVTASAPAAEATAQPAEQLTAAASTDLFATAGPAQPEVKPAQPQPQPEPPPPLENPNPDPLPAVPGTFAAPAPAPTSIPVPGQTDRRDPPTGFVPGNMIVLEVSGVPDKDAKDLFGQKLGEAVKTLARSYRIQTRDRGDSMTVTVTAVRDPNQLASMITWAKVTRIDGRTIFVEMPPLAASEPRPDASDFVGQVLFDLRSPILQRRKDALGRLMRAPQDEKRRAEVAKAIEPMLADPDSWGRGDAAKALAGWGSWDNTRALLEALKKEPEFGVRWAILDTLKVFRDPAAAPQLVVMIAENKERGKAIDALKATGQPAEQAVLRLLDHTDPGVRSEGCRILKDIGPQNSVTALQYIALNSNAGDAGAAKDALPHCMSRRAPATKKKSATKGRN